MSYKDCFHGTELCDQCLELLGDGNKQGREEELARIIEILETEELYLAIDAIKKGHE